MAEPTIQLGNGNWAGKSDSLLGFSIQNGRFYEQEFTFSRSTTGTYTDKDGHIKTSATNMPRVDYLNNSNGSLILEAQRTNILTYSNFQNHWSIDDTTIVANNTTSPDGTVNGNLLKGNTNSSRHNIYKSFSPQSTDSVLSVFAKAKELKYIQIASANTVHQYVNFDVSSGVIGNVGSGFSNAKIENYGNGWYRCSVTATNQSNAFYFGLISGLTSSWLESWTMSNDTDGLYIWGAMAETNASYATSYIPTSGSSVTRNQDACSLTNVADRIGQTEGTIYGEFDFKQTGLTNGLFAISDGSFNNFLMVRFAPTHKLQVEGTGGINIIESTARASGTYKIAIKYNSNGVELWVGGSKIIDTSTQSTMSGIDEFMVGKSPYGNVIGCKVNQAQVYNTALSDTELTTLTT